MITYVIMKTEPSYIFQHLSLPYMTFLDVDLTRAQIAKAQTSSKIGFYNLEQKGCY